MDTIAQAIKGHSPERPEISVQRTFILIRFPEFSQGIFLQFYQSNKLFADRTNTFFAKQVGEAVAESLATVLSSQPSAKFGTYITLTGFLRTALALFSLVGIAGVAMT